MEITIVAGARPNFIKISPIVKELKKHKIDYKIVHTGQHYDDNMSKIFFENLDIPNPDKVIESKSSGVMDRFSIIMKEFGDFIIKEKPDLVLVVGDVDSTFACAFAARRLGVKVAHVEAGLRSKNEKMPEETNRILTDHVSDYLFITENDAMINLVKEGIDERKIHLVGNVMIDSLLSNMNNIKKSDVLNKLDLDVKEYAVVTLHRPENVDSKENLKLILDILDDVQKKIKMVLTVHPRTKTRLEEFGLMNKVKKMKNFALVDPVGYVDFLNLIMNSKFVMTDSGGITEEASVLDVPCLTMRAETERPITVHKGTNTLVNHNKEIIRNQVESILNNKYKKKQEILYWDGNASERIVEVMVN